jgi:polyphosphate kinase 2 (PPK2 family)
MLDKTDTDHAPWHVIPTDHKKQARLAALAIIADALGRGVKITEHELDPRIAEAARKLWGWKPDDKNDGGGKK